MSMKNSGVRDLRAEMEEVQLPEDDALFEDIDALVADRELFISRISQLKQERKQAELEQRVDDSIAIATRMNDLKQAVRERQIALLEAEKEEELDKFDEKYEKERRELIFYWLNKDEAFRDAKERTYEEIEERFEAERAELEMKTATAVNAFKPSPSLLSLQASCRHLLAQQKYDEAKDLLKREKRLEERERKAWEDKCFRKLNALEARANQKYNEELRQADERFTRLERDHESLKKKAFGDLQKKRDWRLQSIERKYQDEVKQLDVKVTEKKPVVRVARKPETEDLTQRSLTQKALRRMLKDSPQRAGSQPSLLGSRTPEGDRYENGGHSSNSTPRSSGRYSKTPQNQGSYSANRRTAGPLSRSPSSQRFGGLQDGDPPARRVQVDISKATLQKLAGGSPSSPSPSRKRVTRPAPLVRSNSARNPPITTNSAGPFERPSSAPRSRGGDQQDDVSPARYAMARANSSPRSSSVGRSRSAGRARTGQPAQKIQDLAATLSKKRNEWLNVCMELGAENGLDVERVIKELGFDDGKESSTDQKRERGHTRGRPTTESELSNGANDGKEARNGISHSPSSHSARRRSTAQQDSPAALIHSSAGQVNSPPVRSPEGPNASLKYPKEESKEDESSHASAADKSSEPQPPSHPSVSGDLRIFGEVSRQQAKGYRSWEKLFLSVRGNFLECYKNESDFKNGIYSEAPIELSGNFWVWPSGTAGFEIEFPTKTLHMKAKSADDAKNWMSVLSDVRQEATVRARKAKYASTQ